MDPKIFRRYDIRGVAGTELTEDVAFLVGRALGTRIRKSGSTSAAVGRDVRHSSEGLAAKAIAGLKACGLIVSDLGLVPTPVVYHALHRDHLGGGIMVTGSHNPKSDNGLKLCLGTASLYGDQVSSLRDEALAGDFRNGEGAVIAVPYLERYLNEITSLFRFRKRHRVGVDCGNGVMGPVVLAASERLGLDVIPLYCEPDGDFPNHLPDPEVPKYMKALSRVVTQEGAALGLGFDGDGDRVGVLDEKGEKISADALLVLFARDLLKRHPGGKIRFDVKCSDFVADDVSRHGGIPVMGETGHSILKRDVKALDAILGGELSGHIVFNRGYLPIDDSLYSALTILRLLEESDGKASALFSGFPRLVSTAEIKVPCSDESKFGVVADLVSAFRATHEVNDLDGARVRVEGGWFLVRASNTTPNLTVRFEAEKLEHLKAARDLLVRALRPHPGVGVQVLFEEVPS